MRHELRVVDLINCSLALRQVLSDITFSRVSFEHFIFFYPSSSVDVQDVHGL